MSEYEYELEYDVCEVCDEPSILMTPFLLSMGE